MNLATSAGLSQSYREKIKRISWEINWQKIIFILVNLLISGVALYFIRNNTSTSVSDILSFTIQSLPTLALITPLIWIAKRRVAPSKSTY